MIRICFYISFLVLFFASNAQKVFKPQNLGETVNTVESELNPIISPDGKVLYFIRVNDPNNAYGAHNSQDIWLSELQPDGTWGTAVRLDEKMNKGRFNAVLGINQDGTQMLISGKYKKNGTYYEPGLSFMYHKGDEDWSNPITIKLPGLNRLLRGKAFNASMSPDGKYIVVAGSTSIVKHNLDIYISENYGDYWSELKKVYFKDFDTKDSEEAPFLTLNNDIMYFSSKKKDGSGSYDIYVSKRVSTDKTEWEQPKLLESLANTNSYESYFVPNLKMSDAFYVSKEGAIGGTDIFKIKLKELSPFVVVKGKIFNKSTNAGISSKKSYTILLNDKASDSIRINVDSSTFEARLPFGKKYKLLPSLKFWNADTATIDATNIKEYVEIKQDLYLTPKLYAKVGGNFLITSTRSYVPYGSNLKLYVDNVLADSTSFKPKVNQAKASYELELPWGKKYVLQYKALKYNTVADTVDLTTVDEYKEIANDLFGEKLEEKIVSTAMATIVGKVFNKKTNKPFANIIPYVIQVDKLPYPYFEITSTTGEYRLVLPLADSYTINARATGYYPIFEILDIKGEKNSIKIFKDLVIAPIEVGVAVRMNNIFFQSGKSILDPKSFPELDKFAKFLMDNPGISVEIGGHTDNVGKADKNMLLSRWRARAVELYLEGKGADKDKVTFNGYGSTKPVAPNKTPKGKALNRRVEFTIKGME